LPVDQRNRQNLHTGQTEWTSLPEEVA